MAFPVAEILRAVRPCVPAFLDAGGLEWCERVAEQVPSSARSHYIECRLGDEARVDFMSSFDNKRVAAEYRDWMSRAASPTSIWHGNLRLLEEWANTDGVLCRAPYLWFEYDSPKDTGCEPLDASPSVALESNYYARHRRSVTGISELARPLTQATLSLLMPSRAAAAWVAAQRCFDALPAEGAVGYLSVMSARKPVTAKLYLAMPRVRVAEFLERALWPGDIGEVEALLKHFYAPAIRTAFLDITVTDRIQDRIGIATSQFHRIELAGTPDESAFPGLPPALESEGAALKRWAGVTATTIGGTRTRIRRWLDMKAVLDGNVTQYKAYLGFMPPLQPDND